MSSDRDVDYKLKSTCRTCLKCEEILIPIFYQDDADVSHIYFPIEFFEELKMIQVLENDGLPQNICTDCMNRMSSICEFYRKCRESQRVLEKHFQKDDDHELKYEVNIDETENEEESGLREFSSSEIDDEQPLLKCEFEEDNDQPKQSDTRHACTICEKTFSKVSNRNTHLQSHSQDNSFVCGVCGKEFKSNVYLSKHRKAVHTISHHKCPHCVMLTFDSKPKYEYHLKSHDPDKKYKCQYCEKSFLQSHHLANHERTHTNHRPYHCDECGKDFKQDCNFKLHLRIHSGLRPYKCPVENCGKTFVQRGALVLHKRQHSGIRPYQCEHCGKSFIQKSSLDVHLRTHSGIKPYKCKHCEKAFTQAHQLKYHLHAMHKEPKTVVKSSTSIVVESEPSGTDSPRIIKRVPEGTATARNLPYVCSICNRGFKLPSSLATHIKIHTEERKHICTLCGNSFKRAEHLKVHINGIHLKQKPFSCGVCDKRFAQSGDRNIHMRRHSGEKPFTCPYCEKSFRLLKAMKAHTRLHTGETPYSCNWCTQSFRTYATLAVHTFRHPEHQKEIAGKAKEAEIEATELQQIQQTE